MQESLLCCVFLRYVLAIMIQPKLSLITFTGRRVHCRVSPTASGLAQRWRRVSRSLMHTGSSIPTIGFNTKRVQKGHVTLKWWVPCSGIELSHKSSVLRLIFSAAGIWGASRDSDRCGSGIVEALMRSCKASFSPGRQRQAMDVTDSHHLVTLWMRQIAPLCQSRRKSCMT